MRWMLKAAVQRALSALPAAERANYVLQRHVTRSLPCSDEILLARFDESVRHVERLHVHAAPGRRNGVEAYEFGAGWDLIGPLAFWMLGIQRQVLVDIRPSLRLELVEHTMRRLRALHSELERRAGRPLPRVGDAPAGSLPAVLERFGITYLAPCDARATGLPAGAFDLISSTFTLEHVPPADIVAILRECGRLLRPAGVLSCSIDLQDHYSFDDPRISVYNFLRYSPRTWRMVNSSLHHQNRLRARDHVALFRQAGLRVLDVRVELPDDEQRLQLDHTPLDAAFRSGYTPDELAATSIDVVATGGVPAPHCPICSAEAVR